MLEVRVSNNPAINLYKKFNDLWQKATKVYKSLQNLLFSLKLRKLEFICLRILTK